jgi:hypothetical protein
LDTYGWRDLQKDAPMDLTSRYIESETEISVTYPPAPDGLSDDAAAIDAAVIWDRLEAFTNFRWSETVVEIVVNPDHEIQWKPPYAPFVVDLVNGEPANPDQFGAVTIRNRAIVRATIGGAVPSETVKTAYRRLSEYFAVRGRVPAGAQRYSVNIGGDISESISQRSDHMARAMHNSGAADLLRKFKKAGAAYV